LASVADDVEATAVIVDLNHWPLLRSTMTTLPTSDALHELVLLVIVVDPLVIPAPKKVVQFAARTFG